MLDVQDFMSTYYGEKQVEMISLKEFCDWKDSNGRKEWDYPLNEYDEIALHHKEDGTNYMPVRFTGDNCGYEYRFCEIPEC